MPRCARMLSRETGEVGGAGRLGPGGERDAAHVEELGREGRARPSIAAKPSSHEARRASVDSTGEVGLGLAGSFQVTGEEFGTSRGRSGTHHLYISDTWHTRQLAQFRREKQPTNVRRVRRSDRELSEFGERFEKALGVRREVEPEITANAIRVRLGMSGGTISKLIYGDRGKWIDPKIVFAMARALDVNAEWLFTGRGPMRDETHPPRTNREKAIAMARIGQFDEGTIEHALKRFDAPEYVDVDVSVAALMNAIIERARFELEHDAVDAERRRSSRERFASAKKKTKPKKEKVAAAPKSERASRRKIGT